MVDIDFSDPFSNANVGVVISSLEVQGGGEKVCAVLADAFNAPLYTVTYKPEKFDDEFNELVQERVVRLEPDGHPFGEKGERTPNLRDEDDSAFTLGVTPTAGAVSVSYDNIDYQRMNTDVLIATDIESCIICYYSGLPYVSYIHHPEKTLTDYFWEQFDRKDGIINKLKFLNERWRSVRQMKNVAKASDKLMANSVRTQQRTIDQWDVPEDDICVVYPPVDTDTFTPGEPGDVPVPMDRYFLAPQRLEPYKNVNTLIEAAKSSREHLVIVGHGTMEDYVRTEAQYSRYIHTLGYVPEEQLLDLYRDATATIQGTLKEDFGIVPVESMSCGTPCIVPASGGFLETVGRGYEEQPVETYETERGLLLGAEDFNQQSMAGAMQNFDPDDYDSEDISESVQRFSTDAFVDSVDDVLQEEYEDLL